MFLWECVVFCYFNDYSRAKSSAVLNGLM